ncbi:hypothetical protein [Reyranella sp.]|uniref:hypothetical protein n=1 Tax=Reyranella sp. TaxID=1929291 RepID=UPI003BADB893
MLLRLADRRRAAQRAIQRGTDIVDRGKAELAECDRFEQFYLEAKPSAAQHTFTIDPDSIAKSVTSNLQAGRALGEAIAAQLTLKQAIVKALKPHPNGLESGDLLNILRESGYPKLLRTSMSPQLSRMRDKEVVNVEGRWTLIENKEAARLL